MTSSMEPMTDLETFKAVKALEDRVVALVQASRQELERATGLQREAKEIQQASYDLSEARAQVESVARLLAQAGGEASMISLIESVREAAEAIERYPSIQPEFEKARQRLEDLIERETQILDQFQQVREQLAENQAQLNHSEERTQTLLAQLNSLEAAAARAERTSQERLDAIDKRLGALQDAQTQLNAIADRAETLNQQTLGLSSECDRQLMAISDHAAAAAAAARDSESMREQVRSDWHSLQKDLETVQCIRNQLITSLRQVGKQQTEAKLTGKQLRAMHEQLEGHRERVEAERAILSEKLAAVEATADAFASFIEQIGGSERMSELPQQLEGARNEIEDLNRRFAVLQDRLVQVEQNYPDRMMGKVATMAEQLTVVQAENYRFKRRLRHTGWALGSLAALLLLTLAASPLIGQWLGQNVYQEFLLPSPERVPTRP